MKIRFVIAISLLITTILGFAQNTKVANLSDFKTLQVYDGIILTIVRSDSNVVHVTNTELNPEQFTVTEIEGHVKIRLKQGFEKPEKAQLKLHYNSISKIETFGKAEVWTENLILGDSIEIIAKSGSQVYANLDIKYISAKASEGSLIKGDGYAIEQFINISSNATFSGFTLEGEIGEVTAGTGGKAKVNISDKLVARARTKGYIGYKGSPKIDSKSSIGGQIINDID